MGHAMQHLMTESQYSEIAGLSNLEWDAVQVSSQFFQTWWATLFLLHIISHFFSSLQFPMTSHRISHENIS